MVSIAIPMFNAENMILEVLESIENQEYKDPLEIVVGDDCSEDHSLTIVKEYAKNSRHNYIILETNVNLGVVNNMRRIYNKCTKNYIVALSHDDILNEKKILKQLEVFSKFPDIQICTHEFHSYCLKEKKIINSSKFGLPRFYKLKDVIKKEIPTVGCMFRNFNLPDYDERCPYADTLFFYRLLGYTNMGYHLNEKLLFYGRHEKNMTHINNGEINVIKNKIIETLILLVEYPKLLVYLSFRLLKQSITFIIKTLKA